MYDPTYLAARDNLLDTAEIPPAREDNAWLPMPGRALRRGRVYFIRAIGGGAIKIGFSAEPKNRLGAAQTYSPHKLVLVGSLEGTQALETRLHQRFAAFHLRGEWFREEILPEVLHLLGFEIANGLDNPPGGMQYYSPDPHTSAPKIRAVR
jgi:hypothetical protein